MWNEIKDFAVPELMYMPEHLRCSFYDIMNRNRGIFIAESPKVIERALKAGYQPISFLVEHKDL